jgi:hypothetical protein
MDPKQLAGRAPESLTWGERQALVGKIMAVKIYSPRGGCLRRIEAVGDTAGECIQQLSVAGLDPRDYEFIRVRPW